MLGRDLLPRPDLLVAFVRACGEEERVAQWCEARERIARDHAPRAAAQVEVPQQLPRAKARGGFVMRPLSLTIAVIALVVTAVVAAIGAVVGAVAVLDVGPWGRTLPGRAAASVSAGATPPTGWVTIRVADAPGLCLTDGRVRDWRYTPLVAVQRPCDETAPQNTLLEFVGDGRYRIQWHHPDYGTGCLKALTSGQGAGLLEPKDNCDDGSLFSVEPSGELDKGRYVLRVEGQGCVGIRGSSAAPGAEAVMQRCVGKGRQVFLIRAVD
ncbi:hypothetical protein GCM10012275_08980 [Longimycelium tulufanense]|uniref:Ricin B lectin domain-containing protein n=1 Tax=Longimycelium tulufanense TaxID=907463 RepID=A0A8J3FV16_9PSEU|nr:XRE family transcriptional regulator [Longimycelium tulufanense]GGM40206.1 hypothetical protein GCM10012275_08980 [Longimycelium tulufanense]